LYCTAAFFKYQERKFNFQDKSERFMCGIVGVVGNQPVALRLVDALKRLEYRGYDSAGVATIHDGALDRRRAEGKLFNLEKKLSDEPLAGVNRHCTYALGNPRRAD